MGRLLKPNGPWKPPRLVLDLVRRLSRSQRPKLLYDGRHPLGSGDQWPVKARISWQRREMRGSIRFGCQLLPHYRMYLQDFHSQFFSFHPTTQHSNWVANVLALFIVASVIWNQIFCSNPVVFVLQFLSNSVVFGQRILKNVGVHPSNMGRGS